ncbi:hypothetical protein DFH08DRAFT_784990 [Mycena albidolilacea]|uniref:Nephrocystin 3-like N-terminal domain-containing protein n=1 Tax=Mycena albidolilacea TaxID=1033008 RepID=A0AAD6ZR92_9AGAR|nr:hypothetical protein DFH08DRAFT_784990 [Mycena albidolilacea]
MPSFFRPKSGDALSPPTKDKKRFGWLSRPGSPATSSRVPSPTPAEFPVAPYQPALPAAQSLPSVLGLSLVSASNATLEQPDSPLPWKPFTLNASVLHDLHEWNKIHQNAEDRLPNVLRGVVEKVRQKVATTIDSKGVQIALDTIPNGTIPAGNIVKGLVWMTVLCLNIPERKKAAYDFAIQTAERLNAMANAFGATPLDDYLTQQCIHDLKPFCDIVNDICEWAHKQVTSKGAFDDQPQAEFKQKLDNATKSFLTISTIRTMYAISALDGGVAELLNYNQRTARLVRINRKFGNLIATQYQSKDQDKEKCHKVTRASVLEKLNAWIRASSNEEFVDRCWWMTGIAGVGKTAIAISTVQYLLDRQPLSTKQDSRVCSVNEVPILYGQYFCNHKLDTSKLQCLFPTLAIQIAETSPAAAHIIDTALEKTPSLAHVFNFKQAKEIFLKPLCHLAKASPSITLVIVIDGVDEFQPAPGMPSSSIYQEVTTVLAEVAAELPMNARLVILSRPEHEIIKHLSPHTRQHDLPTGESFNDVRQYFQVELPKLGVVNFPGTIQLDILSSAAAGHLGWATQAVRWLFIEHQWFPNATLDEKIKAISQDAAGDLDELYKFILSRSLPPENHCQRSSFVLQFQQLLRCLTGLNTPQPIHVICELIQSDGNFDVLKCLRQLSSIYAKGIEAVTLDTVPQPHKSFFDFITARALGEFHIEVATAHRELASSCFRIMKEHLHFNMGGFVSPLLDTDDAPLEVSAHISYACSSFAYHVKSSETPFVEEIHHWAQELFLFWLEVLVLLHGGRLNYVTEILETFKQGGEFLAFMVDTNILSELRSITAIYTSALPFAHNSLPIAHHYRSQSSIHSQWNRRNLPTKGNYGHVISPDGRRVATSTENRLTVFSVMEGVVIWLKQTSSWAGTPFFSPDGQILTCNDNGHIQLFKAASGDVVKELNVRDDRRRINHVAISPQNDYIAVVLLFRYVRIFRIEDGVMTWQSKKTHTNSVSYLYDGRLANVYADNQLVNGRTGESLDVLLFDKGIIGGDEILCISMSSDTSLLAVGPLVFESCPISIWSTQSGQLVTRLEGHKNTIFSTSFSSHGNLLVSGSADQTARVWQCCPQTRTWSCIAVLYGHSYTVLSVAFLPDDKCIISAGADHTIRIWDISAVLKGKEFEVHLDKGALVVDAWFRQGICLGGWRLGNPFLFQYPFELPEGVQPLEWQIQSEQEDEGKDTNVNKLAVR